MQGMLVEALWLYSGYYLEPSDYTGNTMQNLRVIWGMVFVALGSYRAYYLEPFLFGALWLYRDYSRWAMVPCGLDGFASSAPGPAA